MKVQRFFDGAEILVFEQDLVVQTHLSHSTKFRIANRCIGIDWSIHFCRIEVLREKEIVESWAM